MRIFLRPGFFGPTCLAWGCLALGLCLLPACGDQHETHEFTDIRDLDQPRHDTPPGMDAMERLGLKGRPGTGRDGRPGFSWKTPDGWEEVPGSSMRTASWRVKGEAKTDVGLTLMPRGDVAANLNRWRKEMGLAPLDADGVAGLPRRRVLDLEGVYLDEKGDYNGGAGGKPVGAARLLGIVVQGGSASVFLKFTGPAAVVTAQKEQFEALADSLDFAARTAEPSAGRAAPKKGPTRSGALQWTAPEGWEAQPKRMMRVVTLVPKDLPTAWCYVSIVGGSIFDNANRWRAEIGHDPLSQQQFDKITRISMLDTEAILLDLVGDFHGTGGPALENARLFGVICPRGQRAVFIKMVGPKDEMEAQKENFIAFCKSLR